MAALIAPYLNTKSDSNASPNLVPRGVGVAASTLIYANALVAKNSSGYLVPASATAGLVVLGRALTTYDNSAAGSTNGLITADVERGCFDYDMGTGADALTIADIGNVVYASDDHTVNRTDAGGTRPPAGILMNVWTEVGNSNTKALVLVGFAPMPVDTGIMPTAFKARAVITSIAAYVGTTTGTLTASATGAIGTQDGITLVAGDVVFLPAVTGGAGGTTAAGDEGPYVVTSPGGTGVKFVLTRPSWWAHGETIVPGTAVDIGEGTKWAGIAWKCFCAKGKVVDTDASVFYPRLDYGTGAVGTQVTAVWWRGLQSFTANDTTANHSVLAALASAGQATATIDFTGTGTDAIKWSVINF